jgi:glycine/D-amino acid oxidase-like deaminating enzyme
MPVWAADRSRPLATEAHLKPLSVDVVVIGAGITGALIAETTTALGLTTVILDRRPPIGGSTAASTALLQFEIDMPLVRLADHIGFANASRVWRRSYNAVDDLERMVRRLQISCAFRSRRSLYLAGTEMGAADLKEEARQRRAIGLPSVFLDQGALHGMAGIDRAGAILSEGAGDVDPVRLAGGLLRRAMARGCRIFSPVELAEVAPSSRAVEMFTSDGVELEARGLIFAT